jgi:hypothetical protein
MDLFTEFSQWAHAPANNFGLLIIWILLALIQSQAVTARKETNRLLGEISKLLVDIEANGRKY